MKILASGLMVLALTIISCSKDSLTGDIGPIGPKGEQGVQGEKGDKGEPGEDGTANVMHSDWLNQDFNFADNPVLKEMHVEENLLTNNFLENGGIVLGFFRYHTNVLYNLPYIINSRNTMRSVSAISDTEDGIVVFTLISTDGSDMPTSDVNGVPGSNAQFKYVLIPGGVSIAGRSEQPNFKKMSYYAVMDYFGLEY